VLKAGGERLGFVPRAVAAAPAAELDAGLRLTAVVLRERRTSPRGPRSGLTMLLASARAVRLRSYGPG